MEAIVEKIRKDLVELVNSYQGENATQRLLSEFSYATFLIIPEKIRTEDMKQSTDLREEMMNVFEEQDPTKSGTPYLGQLQDQDSCYAARNCKFDFGQTLYQCTLCKKNFVCKKHEKSPCMLCLADRNAREKMEKSSNSMDGRKAKVEEVTGDDKNAEGAGSGDEEAESGDEEAESGDEEAESGDRKVDGRDEEVDSRDGDTDFRGEDVSDKYNNVISKDKDGDENESGNVYSRNKGTDDEQSAAINKNTDETHDIPSKEKQQERAAKFQVEVMQNLSTDDFNFERGNYITELQICQVKKRSGELIWVVEKDYLRLKEMYVRNEADGDDVESEGSGFGWKNRENEDIGK
jgi:hypothetical protein